MKTQAIIDTLNYVKKFKNEVVLIKLGGSILDDDTRMASLCEDITLLRASGLKLVLVHGGSKAIEQSLNQYQLSWNFVEGQRQTTPEMMQIIEMVLCGKVNQHLVRTLNTLGVDAVGLSGCDQKLLQAKPHSESLGEVGVIHTVNTQVIQSYLDQQTLSYTGVIPIISPVAISATGTALNVNADWAASKIATALNVNKLIYLTDQDGILDATGGLQSEVDVKMITSWVNDGTVQGGMLTKCETILSAIELGIDCVHMLNAKKPHVLIDELFTPQGVGTICYKKLTEKKGALT